VEHDQRSTIASILARTRRIAVVGASPRPGRPSNEVMAVLLDAGYDVVPVTPNATEVHGIGTVPALADVDGPIDLVDVFRRREHLTEVAHETVEVGAGALWLQSGLVSAEAREIATSAQLPYVEDACLAVLVRVLGAHPAPEAGS
jgi:uncharacterized protein